MPRRLPDHVPADVLRRPDFIEACANRDLGAVFRIARKWAGFTNSRLARRCEMGISQIADYANGQVQPTATTIFERTADGLHIPGRMLGLDARPWETSITSDEQPGLTLPERTTYTAIPLDAAQPSRPTTPPDASTESFDGDPQSWQLMDALTRSNLSADTIAQLERAVFANAARYPWTSPAQLLPVVLGQLNRLQTALLNTQSLRVLRQCVQLTGILAGLTGNLYLDLGDPHQATDYFELGRAAGREAEDDALTAWVMTTQSIGPFFSGHPEQAAGLLDQASRLVMNTGNKRREAWVNAMAARAHAACGSRDLALSSLDRSAVRLAVADDPSGVDFFDLPRLDGIAGSCHLRLGDTATSARMLHSAIEQRASSDTKGRALLVFDLAECKIVEGEIEEACHLATSALDLAADLIVHPIADRAKEVHDGLSRWHELGPVATFAERLREAPASLPAQRG